MKSLKIKSSSFFIVILTILIHVSCRKQYDEPPITQIPDGNVITISDLKGMYAGSDLSISEDYNIYANVTTDETDGNFYKEAYIQDATGAIRLRLLASGGLYIGDSIRINLNGTVLSEYNGMIQVDSVDVDKNIVKQATQKFISPTTYSVNQISPALQGYLVQLNDVEFISDELGSTYADAINQFSENRTLTDCNGNTILVRTSGYANFANNTIPADNGSIIAIVGVFNSDIQLYIRDINEVNFTNTRCTAGIPILSKNFDDENIYSGGWTMENITGSVDWTTSTNFVQFGTAYGLITNTSQQLSCETWLISPSIDLSAASNPKLSFYSATFSANSTLEACISTDYTSGDPNSANWTPFTPVFSSGSWNWVNSGDIDLSSYLQNNVHIAFKFNGDNSDYYTWEIDEIIIQE